MELDRLVARYCTWRSGFRSSSGSGHGHELARGPRQLDKLRGCHADEILPYLRPISRSFLQEIVLAVYEEDDDCIVDRHRGRVHFRHCGWVAIGAFPFAGACFSDYDELKAFAAQSSAAGMHTAVFVHTGNDTTPAFARLEGCDVRLLGGDELVRFLKEGALPDLPCSVAGTRPRGDHEKSRARVLRAHALGS